jgi:hypothetical protein
MGMAASKKILPTKRGTGAMEYYSAIKNEVLMQESTWMNLKSIM